MTQIMQMEWSANTSRELGSQSIDGMQELRSEYPYFESRLELFGAPIDEFQLHCTTSPLPRLDLLDSPGFLQTELTVSISPTQQQIAHVGCTLPLCRASLDEPFVFLSIDGTHVTTPLRPSRKIRH
jgi:hypothetical protein